MSLEALLGTMADAHSHIPGEAFEAEQRAVCREAGDGSRASLPSRMEVVKPDLSDVAVEALHAVTLPLRLAPEVTGRGKSLVEEHLVEVRLLESLCVRRLKRCQ